MPNAFLVSQAHRLAPAIRAGVFEPPGEAVSIGATQALPTQVGSGVPGLATVALMFRVRAT